MAQIFIALLAFAALMFVAQMAVILLLLAGLIFRTKETIGILVFLSAWALVKAYPVPSLLLIGAIAAIAVYRAFTRKDNEDAAFDPII